MLIGKRSTPNVLYAYKLFITWHTLANPLGRWPVINAWVITWDLLLEILAA